MSTARTRAAASGEDPPPPSGLVFDDPLDRPSPNEADEAWGDRRLTPGSTSDLARFLDEKPPHHL